MTYPPEALLEALSTDGVLCLEQCHRYFGVDAQDLSRLQLHSVSHEVGATSKCVNRPVRMFVMKDRRLKKLTVRDLRHAAGLAEMRLRLRASPSDWIFHLHRPDKGRMPDGEYIDKGEHCAVEFDAGSYQRARVLAKMAAYATFDRQIWGAATLSRVEFLTNVARQIQSPTLVIHAPWYEKNFCTQKLQTP